MTVDVMLELVEPFQEDLNSFKSEFKLLLSIIKKNNISYSVAGNIAVSHYRKSPQACHDIEIQLLSKAHKTFLNDINASDLNIKSTPLGFIINSKQMANLSHHSFAITVDFIDNLPYRELKTINRLSLFGITKLPVFDENSLALQTLFAYSNAKEVQSKLQLSLNLFDLIITNKLDRALLTRILESISSNELVNTLNDSYAEYEIDTGRPSTTWGELKKIKRDRGY